MAATMGPFGPSTVFFWKEKFMRRKKFWTKKFWQLAGGSWKVAVGRWQPPPFLPPNPKTFPLTFLVNIIVFTKYYSLFSVFTFKCEHRTELNKYTASV